MLSGPFRYLLYGGSMGSGKSVVMIHLLTLFCLMYPGSRWAVFRKDLARLRQNFLPSWNNFAPKGFFGEVNKQTWSVRAKNGSEVLFLGASEDRDPELLKLRGLELNGAILEEMEVSKFFFDTLKTRCGRWSVPGGMPPAWILGTCNPLQNWVKDVFYAPWTRGELKAPYFFKQAFPHDNPHLSEENLRALEDLPPREYAVYVKGSWDHADEPDQLIQSDWIDDFLYREPTDQILPARLGVDVATTGEDHSVVIHTSNYSVKSIDAWNGADTVATGNRVLTLAGGVGISGKDIRIDGVGVGAGVVAHVRAAGLDPFDFQAGATAPSKDNPDSPWKFFNLRAEGWWALRTALQQGWASVDSSVPPEYKRRLAADLRAPRYSVDEKVLRIESKQQIKKRLRSSPDYGDALMQAWSPIREPDPFVFVSV